jgi:hypothetical protein
MFSYSTGRCVQSLSLSLVHCIYSYLAVISYLSIPIKKQNFPSCCSLLLRRECCSFSNGEYVKAGLAELEHWCYEATEDVSTMQNCVNFMPCTLSFLLLKSSCTVCRLCLGWTEAYQAGCWIPSKLHLYQPSIPNNSIVVILFLYLLTGSFLSIS